MSEKNCNDCNFIFSNIVSFNIHLKNCKNNINYDNKNKYFCPSCNRKFRLFDNLQRHEETKNHIELFNWEKKQLPDIVIKNIQKADPTYDPNIKVINLTRELIMKENKVDIPEDIILPISNNNKNDKSISISQKLKEDDELIKFEPEDIDDHDIKKDILLPINNNQYLEQDILKTCIIYDPFINELQNRLDIENILPPIPLREIEPNKIVMNINDNLVVETKTIRDPIKNDNVVVETKTIRDPIKNDNVVVETKTIGETSNNDSFLTKLIKERQKLLESYTPLTPQLTPQLINNNQNKILDNLSNNIININDNGKENEECNEIELQLEIEDSIDLKDEIIKTQNSLAFFSDHYNNELETKTKTKIYDDPVLNTIQQIRTNNIDSMNNTKIVKLNEPIEKKQEIYKRRKSRTKYFFLK